MLELLLHDVTGKRSLVIGDLCSVLRWKALLVCWLLGVTAFTMS